MTFTNRMNTKLLWLKFKQPKSRKEKKEFVRCKYQKIGDSPVFPENAPEIQTDQQARRGKGG